MELQNGAFCSLDCTESLSIIHETRVLVNSMMAYMILVAVEFRHDEQPEHARLQAALEQQQASCDRFVCDDRTFCGC